jgi:hypothetical protein
MPNWNAGDEITSAKLNKSLAGLAASAQGSPDMTLKVFEGVVRFGKSEVRFTGGDSPAFTAPLSDNRIDLLVINSAGTLEIIQGTATASPTAPTYPATKFVIAEVYLRYGSTSIKNTDDSINGYLYRDARAYTVLMDKFGGDGSDGALNISSGTTTIDLGGQAIVIKNYTSISITGTGKLAFTNPHAGGTLIVLRSQGDVTITSSTVPCIDLKGIGASAGNVPNFFVGTAAVYGSVPTGGGMWDRLSSYVPYTGGLSLITRTITLAPGAAGATGGGGSAGAPGGIGGKGGGAMLIECGGAWNFTTTNGIDISGQDGGNGASGNSYNGGLNSTGPGGGGGGNCGMFAALYNALTANTGTIKAAGGKGGDGGGAGGSWNYGASGSSGGGGAGSMEGAGGNGATGSGTSTPPSGSVGSGNGAGSGGGAGAGFNWGTSNFTGPSSGGAATASSNKNYLVAKNNYFS